MLPFPADELRLIMEFMDLPSLATLSRTSRGLYHLSLQPLYSSVNIVQ